MNPSGDIAAQQGQLIVTSTLLMLLIIVPVIALTMFFAWRYRQSNTKAEYEPDWDHSTQLELVIWGAPLLIIIALGAITWISTHKLDPYRPLDRIDAQRPVPADVKPLVVQVVALDWKWLFIYPEQGIATVNELAAPVDRPIEFQHHLVHRDERVLRSRAGRHDLRHAGHGDEAARGDQQARRRTRASRPTTAAPASRACASSSCGMSDGRLRQVGRRPSARAARTLTRAAYLKLEKPSEREPVRRFAKRRRRPVRGRPQPLRRRRARCA